jgi:hypothetical protein
MFHEEGILPLPRREGMKGRGKEVAKLNGFHSTDANG